MGFVLYFFKYKTNYVNLFCSAMNNNFFLNVLICISNIAYLNVLNAKKDLKK